MMALSDCLIGNWCPSLGPSASLLLDRTARNTHGAFTNLTPANGWQAIPGGWALRTTGTDQGSQTLNQPHVLLRRDYSQDAMTFSGWFLPAALNRRGLCSSGPQLASPRFAVTLLTTGRIEIYRGTNVTSTGSISVGVWSHVVVTCTGTQTAIYLNGKFDSIASQTPTALAQTTFLLGGNYWGPFEGWSDDYAVWQRPLTAPEVQQLYTPGRGGWLRQTRRRTYGFVTAGFKAYWARQRAGIIGGGVR